MTWIYDSHHRSRVCILTGFTLLEVLVSLVVAAWLTAGVSLVLHDLSNETRRLREVDSEKQYLSALDIITSDVRGIVKIEPISTEVLDKGQPLAQFLSTHRINAIVQGRWAGSARIGYLLAEQENGGKKLLRWESSSRTKESNKALTCLVENIVDVRIELHRADGWSDWPGGEQEEQIYKVDSIRIKAVAGVSGHKDIYQLPEAILPVVKYF